MNRQGFTLVELLVVATIISVLAGIGIISYTTLSQQSRDSRRIADLQNLRSALEFYRSDNDYYPANLDLLETDGYLNSVATDPKTKEDYQYCPTVVDGNNVDYELCAFLEDGRDILTCCSDAVNYNFRLTPLGEE